MDCDLVQKHLGAYIDGELEPSPVIELEDHLQRCSDCNAEVLLAQHIKAAVRERVAAPEAPAALRRRVGRALDGVTPASERTGPSAGVGGMLLAAAAVVLLGVFSGRVPSAGPRPMAQAAALPMLRDVVQRHKDEVPLDVEEGEPERVTSWFRSRLAFPVRSVRFNEPGAKLLGARVSHVGSQDAAKLDYQVGDKRVTAVVFRATPDVRSVLSAPSVHRVMLGGRSVAYQNIQGYTVPVFEDGGLVYAFTGDLDEAGLLRLAASARVP